MTFAEPIWLAALAVPLALLLWHAVHRPRGVALPFDHVGVRERGGLAAWLRFSGSIGAFLAVVVVLLAAEPTRLAVAGSERDVTNIEICLDVSGSMTSQLGGDSRTSRYDAAMEAIARFTEARRGDELGLTIFGGENVRWTPRTKDLEAIRLAAPFLDPARQPPHMRSTRIGGALRACRDTLAEAETGDRMVVLISDGYSSDLGGAAAYEVGAELAEANITLYAIHVGGATAPAQLYDVVAKAGGRVFAAGDEAGLREVFEAIDRMEPARDRTSAPKPAPWYQPLALLGLGFCALQLLFSFGVRPVPH